MSKCFKCMLACGSRVCALACLCMPVVARSGYLFFLCGAYVGSPAELVVLAPEKDEN